MAPKCARYMIDAHLGARLARKAACQRGYRFIHSFIHCSFIHSITHTRLFNKLAPLLAGESRRCSFLKLFAMNNFEARASRKKKRRKLSPILRFSASPLFLLRKARSITLKRSIKLLALSAPQALARSKSRWAA